MKSSRVKVVGAIALVIGLTLLTIWAGTWIAIASESGLDAALRRGYKAWPENVAQFALWAVSVLFIVSGLCLLTRKKNHTNAPAAVDGQNQTDSPTDSLPT